MKRNRLKKLTSVILSLAMAVSILPGLKVQTTRAAASTPYDRYGNIQIRQIAASNSAGYISTICDESGNPIQLRGMSTFGLQWGEGSWVLNGNAFDALAYDWKCDIVRLVMYVGEDGYSDNPSVMLGKIEQGIELATERGMYVLVDWHILNDATANPASSYCSSAGVNLPEYAAIRAAHPEYTGPQLFFAYLSQKYGSQGNVLFETANEPNGVSNGMSEAQGWTTTLLPYHQGVVDAIRTYDADNNDNIVICGTDNWDQFVDAPIGHLVQNLGRTGDDTQVAYTLHFYAGTHDYGGGNWLKGKVSNAIDHGMCVFCTEWGTSEADGDGGVFVEESQVWLDFLEENNISWCNWSVSLKDEAASALVSSAPIAPIDTDGDGIPNWAASDLTASGSFVRDMIRENASDEPVGPTATPSAPTATPTAGAATPTTTANIIIDFDSLNPKTSITDYSGPAYSVSRTEISEGNNALLVPATDLEMWSAPRVTFSNLSFTYSHYDNMCMTVYSATEQNVKIFPFICTAATNWWGMQPYSTIRTTDWVMDETTGLYRYDINFEMTDVTANDKLGHITLCFYPHDDIYLDNIGFDKPNGGVIHVPQDDPGTFMGFPYDFEEGGRQGWKPDYLSQADWHTMSIVNINSVNNNALAIPVIMVPGENDSTEGVRMSSSQGILTYAQSIAYDMFSMDFFLETDSATTGNMLIELVSAPDADPYWYLSGEYTIDLSNPDDIVDGPDGTSLMHYRILMPINSEGIEAGYPFATGVEIRNIALLVSNRDSDYEGMMYWDNITYLNHEDLVTPTPTVEPTATPTVEPTATAAPTATPTVEPTATAEPTATPTVEPTVTAAPTATPTVEPTATAAPTATPEPTTTPTATVEPTVTPTAEPTVTPTVEPTVTEVPSPTPLTGVEGFISRLYSEVLDREADEGGINYWIDQIENGATGGDVASFFLCSEEFLNKEMADDDFLKILYSVFFDREADQGGIDYWLSEMNTKGKSQIIQEFINSEEWANVCASYGIPSGAMSGDPIVAFAERLYTTCLGREGEQGGIDFWSAELRAGRYSGSDAARGFFFGAEFTNAGHGDTEFVTRLYRTFFNREPDAAGMNFWLGELGNGNTREVAFDTFTGCQEWLNTCQVAGIQP